MMLKASSVLTLMQLAAASKRVPVATFDGAKATTWPWEPVNDPVMGGQSESTFHVDAGRSLGIWEGEVKIVPFLKAPGFCNLQAPGLSKRADFPDMSGTQGVVLTARETNASGLTHFNIQIMTKGAHHFLKQGTYMANVTLSDTMEAHQVPWSAFRCSWRGEMVSWCPDLKTQLSEVSNIGFGTAFPGVAAKFSIELQALSAATFETKATLATRATIDLATFGSDRAAKHSWQTENDPVMGGQSESKWTDKADYSEYTGTCRIVPKLNAPGFTFAKTEAPLMGHFPDVSSADGIILGLRNTEANVTSFKFAFCDSRFNPYTCQFGTYKADFSLKVSDNFSDVFLPWSKFSNKWAATTGEHTAENPPTPSSLKSITQLQIWTEGVAGHFDLQVKYIRAGSAPAADAAMAILV